MCGDAGAGGDSYRTSETDSVTGQTKRWRAGIFGGTEQSKSWCDASICTGAVIDFQYDDGIEMPDLLVMTSGNTSGAPICREDEEAVAELSHLCDAMLSHNRKSGYGQMIR